MADLRGRLRPAAPPPGITDPFYFYSSHTGTPCAITGGDFYNPQTPQFPASYTGDYFFADYCGDWIKRIDTVSGAVTDFATGISAPVDIHVDFEGNLHYLARDDGRVYKVVYTGTNAPVITENPQSQLRSVGATATFMVAASGAAPLSYQWQKNSGDIGGATSPSYTTPTLSLGDSGNQYRCVVSNGSGSATSTQAVLTVTTNQTPTATIRRRRPEPRTPAARHINYAGSGSDPEDGSLPADALTWWVNFHHDTHTHPVLPPTSGSTGGSFVVPAVGETSPNVWYRIHLSVIDSTGLTAESFRDVVPRTTTMTFTTSPAGLQLKLDGQPFTAPSTVVGVEGIIRNIEAPVSPGGQRLPVLVRRRRAHPRHHDPGQQHDVHGDVRGRTHADAHVHGEPHAHTHEHAHAEPDAHEHPEPDADRGSSRRAARRQAHARTRARRAGHRPSRRVADADEHVHGEPHADTHTHEHAHAEPDADEHSESDADEHVHGEPDAHTHTHEHAHAEPDADKHSESDADEHVHREPDAHTHTHEHPHTEPDAHEHSEPDADLHGVSNPDEHGLADADQYRQPTRRPSRRAGHRRSPPRARRRGPPAGRPRPRRDRRASARSRRARAPPPPERT